MLIAAQYEYFMTADWACLGLHMADIVIEDSQLPTACFVVEIEALNRGRVLSVVSMATEHVELVT